MSVPPYTVTRKKRYIADIKETKYKERKRINRPQTGRKYRNRL
jgi:hypothetical protein